MKRIECYNIIVSEQTSFPKDFDISSSKTIRCLHSDSNTLRFHPTIIKADPFLFVNNGTLFLFYEEQTYWNPGVIKMTCTKDLVQWTRPMTVLEESCHLSYPFIFRYQGNIYMIPETSKLNEIRLYKSNNDLTCFSFVKTLVSGMPTNGSHSDYADSSLFVKDNKLFLFTTTTSQDKQNELRLYIADDIYDQFREHVKSPLIISNKYGRNGGGIVVNEGKPFRISQDCESEYGKTINVFEITDITPSEYQEYLYAADIFSDIPNIYSKGGHHLNFAMFNDKYIIASDYKEYRPFFFAQTWNTIGQSIRKILK